MITGPDLFEEIENKNRLLEAALRQIGKRGEEFAKSEKNYREALAKKILLERDKGTPVTIISDICRGSSEIAKLRFQRDTAEVLYKAALEACNIYKLQIRLLDGQLEREWSNVK